MTMGELLQALFSYPKFNETLHEITTPNQYELIESFVKGFETVEAANPSEKEQVIASQRDALERYTSQPLDTLYGRTSSYSSFVTNFLFQKKGHYEFCDLTHKLTVDLDPREDNPESGIYLGSIPLRISLYRMDKSSNQWVDVDKFASPLTLRNFSGLRSALNVLEEGRRYRIWEVFYKLK